jgi:outer membrane protein assembly factor BamA
MIHLAKYSFLLIILFSSISYPQKLNSFEVNGNFDFDDSQYLEWSGININQNYFAGVLDSVKSRIAKNILRYGYFYIVFENDSLIFSPDSLAFAIVLDINENTPIVIDKIIFTNLDSTNYSPIIDQFEYLKGQKLNKESIELNIEQLLIEYENSGHPFARIIISSVNVYYVILLKKKISLIFI